MRRGIGMLCAIVAGLLIGPAMAAPAGNSILPGGSSRGPVKINAPSLDYLDKEHKLIYSGGVIAKQGDSTLKASVLTIFLNEGSGLATGGNAGASDAPGGNQIRRIEAAGPVTVISQGQVGTGDSGVYDHAQNSLTLLGNVTLSQAGNVAKGDRLVYDLTTGHAKLSGGVSTLIIPGEGQPDSPSKGKPTKETPRKPADANSH